MVEEKKHLYVNSFYNQNKRKILGVRTYLGALRFWEEHFLRNVVCRDPINKNFESLM